MYVQPLHWSDGVLDTFDRFTTKIKNLNFVFKPSNISEREKSQTYNNVEEVDS